MLRSIHSGFSLVELLVSLATGLMLLAGVLGIFTATLDSQGNNLKMTRLNQELRTTMDLITRDLRRAGYWSLAADAMRPPGDLTPSGTSGNNKSFTSSETPFAPFGAGIVGLKLMSAYGAATIDTYVSGSEVQGDITTTFTAATAIPNSYWMIANPFTDPDTGGDIDFSADDTCIQYTYDRNGDTAIDSNEKFGFRLNSGVVQMHTGGNIDCSVGTGTWSDVTSNSISITDLAFENGSTVCLNLSDSSSDCDSTSGGYVAPAAGDLLLWIREVDITLSGQLASDASVARTLTETVRLRNDRLVVN
jgi:type II secretory pathway component PulJ